MNDHVSDHYAKVVEFMERAGQEVPTVITEPSKEIRVLRAKLILEEALETIQALGCYVYDKGDWIVDMSSFDIKADEGEFNLSEVIDGCCDIKVVTTGTLVACGIPDEEPQKMVDDSNLRKFGPGGYRREDGKWVKPKDWVPPDWAGFLKYLVEAQNERV